MTQREFTERTGVEVSVNEYAAIEMVYMASDVDKDEFCRMWVKMNKSRVERAKAEAKARAEMDAQGEVRPVEQKAERAAAVPPSAA